MNRWRKENKIVFIMLQSAHHPPDIFWKVFQRELADARRGFEVAVNSTTRTCCAAQLLLCFDLPQKADVVGHNGHTGFFACTICEEPGVTVNNTRCYYSAAEYPIRTPEGVEAALRIKVKSSTLPKDDPVRCGFNIINTSGVLSENSK